MHGFLHDMTWVEGLRSAYLTPLFQLLTGLGGTLFLLLFLVFGFLGIHRVVFGRAIAIVLVSTIIGQWLKHYFQDPRPPAALWLDPTVADSFGFPSGHSQVAVALWLWLAYHVRQRWGTLLLITVAAGIVFSRLYLGVHDIEDVLGGMTIGFVILIGFVVWSADRFTDVRERYAVVPLVAAAILTLVSVATWPAGDSASAIVLGGLLCAFWFGYRIEGSRVQLERTGFTMSGMAGIVVVLAILAALSALRLAPSVQAVPTVLILGLYATVFGPVLMARVGLLRRSEAQSGDDSSA